MTYFVFQAEVAVATCTEASNQPTKEQVTEIARMTHSGDIILDKVQQSLVQRIINPDRYKLREIENTLTVIQQCLFIGSPKFVAYFKDHVYAIAALTNYTRTSGNTEQTENVQRRAGFLSRLLQDDERLQRDRSKSIALNVKEEKWTYSPSSSKTSPYEVDPSRGRTLRTWKDWRLTPSAVSSSSSRYLPTPETSPERDTLRAKEAPRQPDDTRAPLNPSGDSAFGASPLSNASRVDLNLIADMTFVRGQFDVLVMSLVEGLTNGDDETQLIKALKKIKHCLLNGSEEFAKWLRDNKNIILPLCNSRFHAVRDLTEDVSRHVWGLGPGGDAMWTRPVNLGENSSISKISTSTDSNTDPLQDPARDLTAFITTTGEYPIASGGSGLVYKATLCVGQSHEVVAKKILNAYHISPARLAKRINREVRAWTRLRHPNIAELYGITREENGSLGLISPFFENGNIEEYLKTSRNNVLQTMIEIAQGVEYLHSQDIVHGDIKGSNIMVDEAGHAKLIDFGLSRIMGEKGNTTSSSSMTIAFAAPELLLLDHEGPIVRTKPSDIYATAITFVQIMSGRAPYRGMTLYALMSWIKNGGLPERPSPMDEECNYIPEDDLWALLLCCWAPKPEDRPVALTVREVLLSQENSALI